MQDQQTTEGFEIYENCLDSTIKIKKILEFLWNMIAFILLPVHKTCSLKIGQKLPCLIDLSSIKLKIRIEIHSTSVKIIHVDLQVLMLADWGTPLKSNSSSNSKHCIKET